MYYKEGLEEGRHVARLSARHLADEVDDDEVKDDVGKDEVGKAALGRDAMELRLVGRVHLEPEADAEDEGGDAGDESAEERVEGEGAHQAAVHKLNDPGEEDVSEVCVDDLKFPGRVGRVLIVELGQYSLQARHLSLFLL